MNQYDKDEIIHLINNISIKFNEAYNDDLDNDYAIAGVEELCGVNIAIEQILKELNKL